VRVWLAVLVLMLAWLQYTLWLGERGLPEVQRKEAELRRLEARVQRLEERNRRLRAEVTELRSGGGPAVVERAREELGMIGEDEIFIRFVRPRAEGSR
jgi:cell division protein FtsB